MSFTTVFVPDWMSNTEMREFAALRRQGFGTSHYKECQLHYSEPESCDVIQMDARVETRPRLLKPVPMMSISIIGTGLTDCAATIGRYAEGDITARVQAFGDHGMKLHTIKVTGTGDVSLEYLNDWFDSLVAGNRNVARQTGIRGPGTNHTRSDIHAALQGLDGDS
jgi:hypothetical protein